MVSPVCHDCNLTSKHLLVLFILAYIAFQGINIQSCEATSWWFKIELIHKYKGILKWNTRANYQLVNQDRWLDDLFSKIKKLLEAKLIYNSSNSINMQNVRPVPIEAHPGSWTHRSWMLLFLIGPLTSVTCLRRHVTHQVRHTQVHCWCECVCVFERLRPAVWTFENTASFHSACTAVLAAGECRGGSVYLLHNDASQMCRERSTSTLNHCDLTLWIFSETLCCTERTYRLLHVNRLTRLCYTFPKLLYFVYNLFSEWPGRLSCLICLMFLRPAANYWRWRPQVPDLQKLED